MKKILIGITGCLGVISSILAIIDVLPQYNGIFLVLIGITVGFALGSFTPDNAPKEEMSEHSKGILLVIIMFITPPFVIILGIVAIWSIGFMTDELIKGILGWGVAIIFISYIVAGLVSAVWAESLQTNNSTQDNSSHNKNSNNNTD